MFTKLKLTQAARKHKIGVAHMLFVMKNVLPVEAIRASGETELSYVGNDDRGLKLHIIAIRLDDETLLVIHAQPEYRK